jgi:hypothetical protein
MINPDYVGSFVATSRSQITSTTLPTVAVSDISISVWFYLPSLSDNGTFVKIGSATTGYGIGIGGYQWGVAVIPRPGTH